MSVNWIPVSNNDGTYKPIQNPEYEPRKILTSTGEYWIAVGLIHYNRPLIPNGLHYTDEPRIYATKGEERERKYYLVMSENSQGKDILSPITYDEYKKALKYELTEDDYAWIDCREELPKK